jgi:predicted negative regulator of RcsB-dependent stress response
MRGLVRCYFKTQQFTTAAPTAAELLLEKGIANDDKLMAGFVLAKNEQSAKNYDLALTQYKSLLLFGKSEITAETQYNIAFIQFGQEKLSDAEKSCFELIKKYGSYEHWVTRSYILIGDIYTKQKDYFNAEATLKSVADNAADEGLRKEASGKLAAVLIEKNKNAKVEAPKN